MPTFFRCRPHETLKQASGDVEDWQAGYRSDIHSLNRPHERRGRRAWGAYGHGQGLGARRSGHRENQHYQKVGYVFLIMLLKRGGGRGALMSCMDRSLLSVDPRIPTMPGWSTSGVHRPGRHCLHQARSAVTCSATRMKGTLHPIILRTAL